MHGRRRSGPLSPTPAPVLEHFGPVPPYGGNPLENGLEGFYGAGTEDASRKTCLSPEEKGLRFC